LQLNEHIQRLSLSFLHRHPTGTILSRMSNDVTLVRVALTDAVASVLKDSVSLVILVGVAFWHDWVLALIAFVAFPASVLPILKLSKRLRRIARRITPSTSPMPWAGVTPPRWRDCGSEPVCPFWPCCPCSSARLSRSRGSRFSQTG
jgi:ABC-type multidrug transport system fused ATPase/permease subunit